MHDLPFSVLKKAASAVWYFEGSSFCRGIQAVLMWIEPTGQGVTLVLGPAFW
jgi:hypothetical protein